jgi:hypothetical protein
MRRILHVDHLEHVLQHCNRRESIPGEPAASEDDLHGNWVALHVVRPLERSERPVDRLLWWDAKQQDLGEAVDEPGNDRSSHAT